MTQNEFNKKYCNMPYASFSDIRGLILDGQFTIEQLERIIEDVKGIETEDN